MQKVGIFKSIHVKLVLVYVFAHCYCNANHRALLCPGN